MLMEKVKENVVEKFRIVLISVVSCIWNHDILAVGFALRPDWALLDDISKRVLVAMCEQERYWNPILFLFVKETRH